MDRRQFILASTAALTVPAAVRAALGNSVPPQTIEQRPVLTLDEFERMILAPQEAEFSKRVNAAIADALLFGTNQVLIGAESG